MNDAFERTYWANDVADLLGISTSALRKWSLRLEAEGYRFIRDEHDRRAYREADLVALRKMKEFLAAKMSLENAAKAVCAMYLTRADTESGTGIVPADKERSDERYLALEKRFDEFLQKQEAFHQALLERIEERDKRLLQAMDAVLETRQMLAAAQEEQAKRKWWQFWKKG